VCFFVSGTGIVGHARLAEAIDRRVAPVRGAERFAAVFRLDDVEMYARPRSLDPLSPSQRLADRVPFDTAGPFLSPISADDFAALTAPGSAGHEGRPSAR
jgi:hypothetical protein